MTTTDTTDCAFDAVTSAKRQLETARIRMNRELAAWCAGAGAYESLDQAFNLFEARTAALKHAIDAHRDVKGSTQKPFSRFDDNGNVRPARPASAALPSSPSSGSSSRDSHDAMLAHVMSGVAAYGKGRR